jgi:tetratricopeptide (TPR) repeat protein
MSLTLTFVLTLSLVIGLFPGSAAAARESAAQYRALGLQYRAMERYSEAIAALKKAERLEPENVENGVVLGWTQHLAGQSKAATETLVQKTYQNPMHLPTLNALGIVLLTQGYLPDAIAVHTWAVLLNPKNETAYYNLSLANHRLKSYAWAIVTAQRAANLEQSNPHPLVALAIAQWGQGNRVAALQAYAQAVRLDDRYRSAEFLQHLQDAGFAPGQIQTAQSILALFTTSSPELN